MNKYILGLFFALIFSALVITVKASSGVTLTPGHIQAESCSETALMPIINWTVKGRVQMVELHQSGNCRLKGSWDKSVPGLYCTGIGSIDGHDWVPDECITIKNDAKTVKTKFLNVFKHRYLK